jgi:plasmid maintenance system antidote protein VapI
MKNKIKLFGEFVKEIAESKNLRPADLCKLIHYTKQNVSDIYKRKSIDSELILTLSRVLDYDFFSYYNDMEPIASFRKAEALARQVALDNLTLELERSTELLKQQEEIIRLLKEKEEFLKK